MNKTKFTLINTTISQNKINQIINILKLENNSSVLAKLNSKNITTYVNRVVESNQLSMKKRSLVMLLWLENQNI